MGALSGEYSHPNGGLHPYFAQSLTEGQMLTSLDSMETSPSLAASRSFSSCRLSSLLSAAAQTKHCFENQGSSPTIMTGHQSSLFLVPHHFIPSSMVMISSSSVTSLGIWAVPLIMLAQASYRNSNSTIACGIQCK